MKMWKLQRSDDKYQGAMLTLEQTIGGHVHSVWDVDCTLKYLVAGSADKTIRVWVNAYYGDKHPCTGDAGNYK